MEIIDYLLARKKAGGGSDVTIEQLTATENGTYSEEGIAYSPVVVNVPTPENSYQLKDVPSGTVSTIDDGTALPIPSLKVGIEPVQDLNGYDHPWAGGAGKNLLQVTATSQTVDGITFTINNDGTINVNGTAIQDISLLLSRKNVSDTPLPEGQLTMTGCPSGGSTSSYYLTCWRTNSGNANDVGGGVTFGYRSDWDFVVSLVIASGTTCNNLIFKPMIRLATETDATFAPYSNICPIEGWTAANMTRCGVNQWDEEVVIFGDHLLTKNFSPCLPNASYYIKGPNVSPQLFAYGFSWYDADKAKIGESYYWPNNVTVTSPNNARYFKFGLAPNYGTTYNHDISINYPSTDTDYHAYNGQTCTIQFRDGDNPLTVYGGTLDVVNGELTVTDAHIASYNAETLPSTWISDRDVYAEGTTPTTGAEVVYKLANSVTYQLTPTQIRTLVGNNNIWSDTGNIISGKYFKSLT